MTAPDPAEAAADQAEAAPLSAMVDALTASAEASGGEVGALVTAAGAGGVLQVMTLVALVVVSPLSAIPFLSTICGLVIALCALQAAIGRQGLWLPGFLRRRRIDPRRLVRAMAHVRRLAHWLERRATRRLPLLAAPPAGNGFLVLAAGYGGAMPFLELVPMSSSLLAFAVVLTGLGLILRDGLLLIVSLLPAAAAAAVVWSIWFA